MENLHLNINCKTKIPCIVTIFYNIEIIKKTLDFLSKYKDRLDIIVVENNSIFTEIEIRPYIMNLLNQGVISTYAIFEKNIKANVLKMLFNNNVIDLNKSEYIIITDGDLVVDTGDWLSEELDIVNSDKDVFACGIDLKLDNLPLAVFPDAYNWFPTPVKEYDNYIEVLTGTILLLMRTSYFKDFLSYINSSNLECIDNEMHQYCYNVIQKKWAKTRNNKAVHLTWDTYNDINNSYLQFKISKSYRDFWFHKEHCSFEVFTKQDYKKFYK